ncbi:MAG: hypothetical protein KZQ85_14765 [Candidatus Thiodiazotropha sp. (ex Myrtea sp. 'scaly one' KF741663)]|nr:hypothetical protein [Candidatus Thiodiazotropha sp. (ex Myrtea sp. 'scaly one' KF741663)]
MSITEEAAQYLREHRIIKRLEKQTGVALDDLLQRKVYIVPDQAMTIDGMALEIGAQYWPLGYSPDLDDEDHKRLHDEFEKHGGLIRQAAMLVWLHTDTPKPATLRDSAEGWIARFENKYATLRSKNGGQGGGLAPKVSEWAKEAASLLMKTKTKNKDEAWDLLPDTRNPWLIEIEDDEYEVYRDGDKIIAVNTYTSKEHDLTKSTFLKNYLKKGK